MSRFRDFGLAVILWMARGGVGFEGLRLALGQLFRGVLEAGDRISFVI